MCYYCFFYLYVFSIIYMCAFIALINVICSKCDLCYINKLFFYYSSQKGGAAFSHLYGKLDLIEVSCYSSCKLLLSSNYTSVSSTGFASLIIFCFVLQMFFLLLK